MYIYIYTTLQLPGNVFLDSWRVVYTYTNIYKYICIYTYFPSIVRKRFLGQLKGSIYIYKYIHITNIYVYIYIYVYSPSIVRKRFLGQLKGNIYIYTNIYKHICIYISIYYPSIARKRFLRAHPPPPSAPPPLALASPAAPPLQASTSPASFNEDATLFQKSEQFFGEAVSAVHESQGRVVVPGSCGPGFIQLFIFFPARSFGEERHASLFAAFQIGMESV